ncbi:uncharacterized protein LOC119463772 [Dermacentor silvarum]|uniref:uncharacterized protein LOC119463772 n=1 Tax=Dermacentor silvarum TaxID=543639 RepID=UPI0021007691|nr:uncharacterized protein LOC119463772 [Dermacentor silvarum]
MNVLRVIFLIFWCSNYADTMAKATRDVYVPKRDPKWNDWQDALRAIRKHSSTKHPGSIGEGVWLHAVVMYDSAFSNAALSSPTKWKAETENNNGVSGENPIEGYFKSLFQELQMYFKNQSILVNITVESVSENNNLTVFYDQFKIINGSATLKNIQTYGRSQGKSNDTIFYLFTWPEAGGNPNRLFDHVTTPGSHRLGVSEVSTEGTFCTSTTSAALIRHNPRSLMNYWSTARATARVFGSEHFLPITQQDREKMNMTFSRCPRYEKKKIEDGDIMQC